MPLPEKTWPTNCRSLREGFLIPARRLRWTGVGIRANFGHRYGQQPHPQRWCGLQGNSRGRFNGLHQPTRLH